MLFGCPIYTVILTVIYKTQAKHFVYITGGLASAPRCLRQLPAFVCLSESSCQLQTYLRDDECKATEVVKHTIRSKSLPARKLLSSCTDELALKRYNIKENIFVGFGLVL